MNKRVLTRNEYQLVRVTKTSARKLWENGKEIAVLPHELNPFSAWVTLSFLSKNDSNESFNDVVAIAEYYSGLCSEVGYYLAYYVKK